MKALFFIALMAPLLAMAADWQLTSRGNKSFISIDQTSVARAGSKIKAWALWDYEDARTVEQSFPPKVYRSVKELSYYNCDERTSAWVQSIAYSAPSGEGESIYSRTRDPSTLIYEDVAPDTVGETLLNRVCELARTKFAPPRPAKK